MFRAITLEGVLDEVQRLEYATKKRSKRGAIAELGDGCLIVHMKRLFAVLMLSWVPDLKSATITYYFEGVWQESTEYAAGTKFVGSFSYETPQQNPQSIPWYAVWLGYKLEIMTIGYSDLKFNLNGLGGDGEISTGHNVYDSPGLRDFLDIRGGWDSALRYEFLGILKPRSSNWWLSLPDDTLRMEDFQYINLGISEPFMPYAPPDLRKSSYGNIISFVPEPSAFSLLAIGLGGWAMMRRRRL